MDEALLQSFCGDVCEWMKRPVDDGVYRYFTNGHIAVRIPHAAPPPEKPGVCQSLPWARLADATWAEWPTLTPATTVEICGECDGTGKLGGECAICDGEGECECDCGDIHDCQACDGTGRTAGAGDGPCTGCQGRGTVDRPQPVTLGGALLAWQYYVLISRLNPTAFCVLDPHGPLLGFRFDGGDGLVAGMRQEAGK